MLNYIMNTIKTDIFRGFNIYGKYVTYGHKI